MSFLLNAKKFDSGVEALLNVIAKPPHKIDAIIELLQKSFAILSVIV